MTDKVVKITDVRRAEMKKGLLYDFDSEVTGRGLAPTDKEIREGIDAATKYLEGKGRRIKTILAQKTVLIMVGVYAFALGIILSFSILYAISPEELKSILGF